MKNIIWWIVGVLLLILGIIGLVLPVIPQVPFLLGSLLSFGKASKRFNKWLKGTKYYQMAAEKLKGTRFYVFFEEKQEEIHDKKLEILEKRKEHHEDAMRGR